MATAENMVKCLQGNLLYMCTLNIAELNWIVFNVERNSQGHMATSFLCKACAHDCCLSAICWRLSQNTSTRAKPDDQ